MEQALIASGMNYTILRHALYADIMVGDLDETLSTGVLCRAGGSAPAEAWPAYMTEHWGVPEELAKSSLGTMRAIGNGEFDITRGDYEAITGRKPKTMRQFLEGVAASRGIG